MLFGLYLLCTYVHTYLHTYIHTYMHICSLFSHILWIYISQHPGMTLVYSINHLIQENTYQFPTKWWNNSGYQTYFSQMLLRQIIMISYYLIDWWKFSLMEKLILMSGNYFMLILLLIMLCTLKLNAMQLETPGGNHCCLMANHVHN